MARKYRNNYDDLMSDIKKSGQSWSQWDLQLAEENPDVGRSLYGHKMDYANATTDEQRRAANQAAEMLRAQYGRYTGGDDGSGFHVLRPSPEPYKPTVQPPAPFQPTTQRPAPFKPTVQRPAPFQPNEISPMKPSYAPEYQDYVSKYQPQIDALLGQIQNRDPFSYDPSKDPAYQALQEATRRNGEQARQQAMGDAMLMNGGQLSSYAVASGMQAQDQMNAQMSDQIPDLYRAAYNMYITDLNQQRADLNTIRDLDEIGYNRHRDDYNAAFGKWQADYGVDRDIYEDQLRKEQERYDRWRDEMSDSRYDEQQEYDRWRDQVSDSRLDEQLEYERWRDQVSDSRYDEQQDYDRWRDEIADSRFEDNLEDSRAWRHAQLMAQAGDFTALAKLGFTDAEIAALTQAAIKPVKGTSRDDDDRSSDSVSEITDDEIGYVEFSKATRNAKNLMRQYDGDVEKVYNQLQRNGYSINVIDQILANIGA